MCAAFQAAGPSVAREDPLPCLPVDSIFVPAYRHPYLFELPAGVSKSTCPQSDVNTPF